MYRSNTLQKTDYLQIYQCQFPTAEFNFNHFHSCSETDHVLLLYILCIDLSFLIPNRIQSVPFHAFYWSCFTSLYIVHLCKKNPLLQKWGRPDQEKWQRRDPIWLGCQRGVRQYSEKVRLSHGQLTAEEDGQTQDYDTSILIDNFHIAEKRLFGNVWCWGWCILCLWILTLHTDCFFIVYNTDWWKLWLMLEIEGYRMYRWSRNDIDIFTDL